MAEVSLETLLLNGECEVQWGTQGHSPVHRTIEIHSTNILYCFVEPKDSMAKHAKEKVYLEGCRVVDGGAYTGACERLLLFLADYDYAEKVDLLGNRRAYIFSPSHGDDAAVAKSVSGQSSSCSGHAASAASSLSLLPSSRYVVQLFLTDKMLKWRLLQAIQRASQEYLALFPDSPLTSPGKAASFSGGGAALASTGSVKGPSVSPNVPNNFESKVLGHTAPQHSRQSSDVSVLSNHEVLQLSDVLRVYDEMQKQRAEESGVAPAAVTATEDVRRASASEEALEETLVADTAADDAAGAANGDPDGTLGTSNTAAAAAATAVPARLQHSPLYASCISCDEANQACADCGAAFPSWCLLQPFGAFVCIECIGVHRKLWSNKCRGAELDLWPPADIAFMQTRGNAVVNDELEYYVAFPADSVEAAMHVDPPVKPVAAFSASEVRESFIQWKYEERLFTRQRHPTATAPLPARQDPAAIEQVRLADTAPTATDGREGDGRAGEGLYASPTQHQKRAFLRDDGPPRYGGLLDVIVKELVGPESIAGAVCVLTNGFQTLRTHAGRQLLNMRHSTAWDEHLQLGIECAGRKPIYCSIYRGKNELLATGEVWLKDEVFQPGTTSMFAATLTWNQLNKKASQRNRNERWKITFLTSYQRLL